MDCAEAYKVENWGGWLDYHLKPGQDPEEIKGMDEHLRLCARCSSAIRAQLVFLEAYVERLRRVRYPELPHWTPPVPVSKALALRHWHQHEGFNPKHVDWERGLFAERVDKPSAFEGDYGSHSLTFHLHPKAKVFHAQDQNDAVERLWPGKVGKNTSALLTDAAARRGRPAIEYHDRIIHRELRQRGYHAVHYTEGLTGGAEEYAVIHPNGLGSHRSEGKSALSKALGLRRKTKKLAKEDWAHDVAALIPEDHDAHMRHHEGEYVAMRSALVTEEDPDARQEHAKKMRDCAVHWAKHRMARHAGTVQKGGAGELHARAEIEKAISRGQARQAWEALKLDGEDFRFDEFLRGMQVELEHRDVTHGSPLGTAKIAVAHLRERPDYYRRLAKMEGTDPGKIVEKGVPVGDWSKVKVVRSGKATVSGGGKLTPHGRPKYHSGSIEDTMEAAARLSLHTGKPVHLYPTHGGYRISHELPGMPYGQKSYKVTGREDGLDYDVLEHGTGKT